MTRLCVPILVDPHSVESSRGHIAEAIEAGADVIELRLDYFELEHLRYFPWLTDGFDTDFIATCRPTWEGGHSELSDAERRELLSRLAIHVKWIDYEYRAVGDVPARIISAHTFTGRPVRLESVYADMAEQRADVVKLAWVAQTIRDNIEAFELLRLHLKPTIALCMGEAGLMSRVLAKKFGAFLTFAALRDTMNTAAGQPTIREMKELYRWDELGPATKVFGVVGDPLGHSMSPAVHNAAFDATGYDGVYLPMPVEKSCESFKAFMEEFRAFKPLDLVGLSVTIPHKEHALRYLDEVGGAVEPLARKIGAVNTLTLAGDLISGRNTDHAAILGSLRDGLGRDVSGLRVGVLGAGGTGRTAVASLVDAGANVTIYNRTRSKAKTLAVEFHARVGDWNDWQAADVWLNTTSVGMSPGVDASIFDEVAPSLGPEVLVWDAVYNPLETKLLRQATAAGAKTVSGLEMFVRQAAAQFETWTGKDAPTEMMRDVVRRRLAPRS